jgi:hypothetical protein
MDVIVATKVIKDKILVFSNFHRRKTVRDEKRGLTSASELKNFAPEHSRICSDHFSDKDFLTSHSPTFLASIGFTGKVNILLKPDAVPSKNAPGETAVPAKKTRPKGRLSQLKVTQHYLIYMF